MLCSISSRNCSRFDFRPYFSNPVCAARVCYRTRVFPPTYTLPAQPVDRRVFQRFPKTCFAGEDQRKDPGAAESRQVWEIAWLLRCRIRTQPGSYKVTVIE